MKTGFIAITVLSLAAITSAYGPYPGSSRGTCVSDCIAPPDVPDDPDAPTTARPGPENATCALAVKTWTCVEGCPAEKYATLARQNRLITEKYCGTNVDETTREKFFADVQKFGETWLPEQEKCGEGGTLDERCRRLSDCVFGSALSSTKNGFSDDVVAVQVNAIKIFVGSNLELDGENLPSCSLVFEPYEPEPPYPYEPYEYNPYQRNPYHRNPYQRNLYQRNPYQRNSYQRNPYKRNPYLRRN